MKILKNTTSDSVLRIKNKRRATWLEMAEMLDMSKQTLYNRMEKGGWKKGEALLISTLVRVI